MAVGRGVGGTDRGRMVSRRRRTLRRAAELVSAVLGAVVLAGCGGGAVVPPAATAQPTAEPVPTVAPVPVVTPTPTVVPQVTALVWTDAVCAALVPVVAQLTAAPPVRLDAPEATRQAYLAYLADGLTTTDRARAALEAAGPAPVADGAAISEQVRGDVADLRAHLVDAQQQVQQTDPGSAAGLGRALVSGTDLVGALLKGAQVAGTINRDPVLHDAYQRSPTCARLQRSGAPVTPGPTPTR
jgi:hypothetical protein